MMMIGVVIKRVAGVVFPRPLDAPHFFGGFFVQGDDKLHIVAFQVQNEKIFVQKRRGRRTLDVIAVHGIPFPNNGL